MQRNLQTRWLTGSQMAARSCLTNLLESLESWTQALDEGFGVDVLYLYYRKAFDSVPHKRLLGKLKLHGINGKLLKWIQSFLEARLMKVGIRGSFYDWIEVLSGVPQPSGFRTGTSALLTLRQ